MGLTPHVLDLLEMNVLSGVNGGLMPFFGDMYNRLHGTYGVLVGVLGHCSKITTIIVDGWLTTKVGGAPACAEDAPPPPMFTSRW